ncbi:hypothetical protein LOTGIDRAFT_102761 [Lottia gigantea]|uniref:cAMP-dependent protein kinase type II regulatory subunit n=1 Tax=Lottia gigantea TaxID=225164 RepID=V4BI15_LOTGI|nr:hypothetical protein LOTGIDRAFT_102761 [Lottia gigantea]ESP05552.1 hypothetical protein LOTGIDRAFT_102761 [Lottia gigantea]
MNFTIPNGLGDMLREFTVSAIRINPDDLYDFAVEYFTKARDERKVKTVPMYIIVDEDEEAGEPDPEAIRKKTNNNNRFARRSSVSAERYDPEEDDDDDEDKVVYPKTEEQRKRLAEEVSHILIFRALDRDQINDVIDAMFEKTCQPNDVIIKQNDDGDNFYVIDSGSYDVYVLIDGVDKKVKSFKDHGSFGELALMYNMPRSATIKATTPGKLWAMDRLSFRRIVLKAAFKKRKLYEELLENVPILKALESYERMNLADSLTTKEYQDGAYIIRQGDDADGMYFIEKGAVSVEISNDKKDDIMTVGQLKGGQYFGELALINNKPRSASIKAVGTVKVAFLERESFERLLGPCLDIMKRNTEIYRTYSDQSHH